MLLGMKQVKARIWMEHWAGSQESCLSPAGCCWLAAWAQACLSQPRTAAAFEHRCAEPCNAKVAPCSGRWVPMVLAEEDPLTLSICLPPLPGVCISGRGDGDCTADEAPNRGSTAQPPTQLWASSAGGSKWQKLAIPQVAATSFIKAHL